MSRRRRLVATAAAAAAAVGAISGGLAYATSDRASSEHTATRQQPQDHPAADRTPLISKPVRPFPPPRTPSWTILESGPDAHSFLIQVDTVWSSAGCPVGAKATVTETTTTIRVHTIELYVRGGACVADARPFRVWITLHHPLNGRTIAGAGLKWPTSDVFYLTSIRGGWEANRVPRVIGFAPSQAVRVLRGQEFHGEIISSAGAAVIAQSPTRGQIPNDSNPPRQFAGTVRLNT